MMVHIAKKLRDSGYLKKAYAFVAYYDEWRDYLENQTDVKFEKLIGTKEIFNRMESDTLDLEVIEQIEKKYGSIDIELANLIIGERYLAPHSHQRPYNHPSYTKEEILLYAQVTFQLVEELFEEVKPDAIIDFASVNILRGTLDLVAQKHNIPFLYPCQTLLSNRYYICRRFIDKYKPILKTYKKLLKSENPCYDGYNYLKWFRQPQVKTIYCHHLLVNKKDISLAKRVVNALRKMASWTLSIFKEIKLRYNARGNSTIRYNYQFFKNLPSIRLCRGLLNFYRRFLITFMRPFRDRCVIGNYVFLTLHYQPEASTTVLSPFFVNQKAVIDGISRALPLGWNLVIKPNLLMLGSEPVSFYRWINSIPNVYLVSPKSDTQKLIEGAKAVIAITGTSGLEAALKGKKVIVMSDRPIWAMIEGITICTDFTKLHRILSEVEYYKANDRNLAAYLQSIHDHSFPMERNYVWEGPFDLLHPGYRKAIETISQKIFEAYETYKHDNSQIIYKQNAEEKR